MHIRIMLFILLGYQVVQHKPAYIVDESDEVNIPTTVITSSNANYVEDNKNANCFQEQGDKTFYNDSIIVDENNVPIDSNQFYFPLSIFPLREEYLVKYSNGIAVLSTRIIADGEYDTLVVRSYSKHLYAMKEPLIFSKPTDREIYRLTLLRSFHNPVVVRIEKYDDNYSLVWKLSDGLGGYEPGKLLINKMRYLTKEDWDAFKSKVSRANIWSMDLGRISSGEDGADWILEAVKPTKYIVVVGTDYFPNDEGFYDACDYLLKLTDLEIKDSSKY
jgi:hypothetical protein